MSHIVTGRWRRFKRSALWRMARRRLRGPSTASRRMGRLLIDYAREFSLSIGGKPNAFDSLIHGYIRKGSDPRYRRIYGDLLDLFMPNYQENIYPYYAAQQYHMLLEFLAYPFGEGIGSYVAPYRQGLPQTGPADVIEYGAGIPFGLIDALLTQPGCIRTITLIDLDLVHTHFVEFVLRRLAGDTPLHMYRLRDPHAFPDLEDKRYNFLFGKDIFEHVRRPEEKLERLIASAADSCVCYFDFRDHGEARYQHVTPQIAHLADTMRRAGFENRGAVGAVTEFTRGL